MQFIRYDEEKQIYRDCRFCGGKGCLACAGEADRDYKAAFGSGPVPILTVKYDDKKGMEKLKKIIHDKIEEEKKLVDCIRKSKSDMALSPLDIVLKRMGI